MGSLRGDGRGAVQGWLNRASDRSALLNEAERLVAAHVLREKEDLFFLRFSELHDVVRTDHVDDELIGRRKDASAVGRFTSSKTAKPSRRTP